MNTSMLEQPSLATPEVLAAELEKILTYTPMTPYCNDLLKAVITNLRLKPTQVYNPKESFFIQASNVRFTTVDNIVQDLANKIRTGAYAGKGYTTILSKIASGLDNHGPDPRGISGKIILELKKDLSDWRLMIKGSLDTPTLNTSVLYMITESGITKFTGVGMDNIRTCNYDFFPPYWSAVDCPQSVTADYHAEQVIHHAVNTTNNVVTEYVCNRQGELLATHVKGTTHHFLGDKQ